MRRRHGRRHRQAPAPGAASCSYLKGYLIFEIIALQVFRKTRETSASTLRFRTGRRGVTDDAYEHDLRGIRFTVGGYCPFRPARWNIEPALGGSMEHRAGPPRRYDRCGTWT